MTRVWLVVLLGLVLLPAPAAQAAGLPCLPCAGLRLDAPPTAAVAAYPSTDTPGLATGRAAPRDLVTLLEAQHLAPGSPLFVAWEVTLPAFESLAAVSGAGAADASPPPPAKTKRSKRGAVPPPATPGAMGAMGAMGAAAATGTPGTTGTSGAVGGITTTVPGVPSSVLAATAAQATATAGGAGPTQAEVAAMPELIAASADARAVAAAGATPWLTLVFTSAAPLSRHLAHLQAELSAAAAIAGAAPPGTWFQVAWRPRATEATGGPGAPGTASPSTARPAFDAADYAFLLKRAAVALTGAQDGVHVATAPLPADAAVLRAFYATEVAAYLDLVALRAEGDTASGAGAATNGQPAAATNGRDAGTTASSTPGSAAERSAVTAAATEPSARLAEAIKLLHELDPGRPLALDALPYPTSPLGAAVAEAARRATAGFDLTFFRAAAAVPVDGATLNPLVVLAREFAGDLSFDAAASPTGASESWAFVRGKDLGLRVIAVTPPAAEGAGPADAAGGEPAGTPGAARPPLPAELRLRFADPTLRRPTLFPFSSAHAAAPSGELLPPPNAGLAVRIAAPPPVVVLGVERLSAAERQGVAEKLTVASQHEISVEEILKRLQVFEDAQNRRLDHYQAINTTHLRFQPNAGAASVEVALAGPFFWTRESGSDWAWQSLFINGVKWRAKTLPEIPLIQPEKAAAVPLEIQFTNDYRYRLRGIEKIGGRDAWVVDFAPAGHGAAGRRLYQGSVWVDRETGARLRTRGVQLGLEGDILSNEETFLYTPVDALGQPAPWSAESFVLPLHLVAQQVLSILDQPTVIERETVLTEVRINTADFVAARKSVEDSDVTMVRDTDKGLRYLVKNGDGPRVVKEGFSPSKLFALGGLFVDDSLSYPLPLGGINYFTFDFKNSGKQVNVFFAGALLIASAAEPRVGGSRFDAGGDVFAIAVPFTDDLYTQGKEKVDQEVRIRPATFDLKIGHPIGSFVNVGFQYGLFDSVYSRNENTSKQFTLPTDNLLQSVQGNVSFARAGYSLAGEYSYNMRSSWHFWGLPGNPDYSPNDRDFSRYDFTASKNWYLPYFQKIGAELDYYSGSNLDRFSKYQFGFFGGTRVHGYRSNAVRASSTYLSHLSYGFDFGSLFRLEALADAALANDREDDLHNRILAGAGLAGSFIGPWQTLVTLDAGVPVAGPDHGFVLYLVFLKLFH